MKKDYFYKTGRYPKKIFKLEVYNISKLMIIN